MNNPFALILLFAAIVTIWAAFILTVMVFMKGAARGRDEYESWLAGEIGRAAHGDHPQQW